MLNGLHQVADWMFVGCITQVMRRRMKIDLRTGDLFVSEEVTDGDNVDALVNEVRSKGVAKSMR